MADMIHVRGPKHIVELAVAKCCGAVFCDVKAARDHEWDCGRA